MDFRKILNRIKELLTFLIDVLDKVEEKNVVYNRRKEASGKKGKVVKKDEEGKKIEEIKERIRRRD